jgi:hypothetical protein
MGLQMAPDLWQQLCAYAAQHANCVLTLHQHDGRVVLVEATERLKPKEQQARLIPSSDETVPLVSGMPSDKTA